jgi:hypothetical protein
VEEHHPLHERAGHSQLITAVQRSLPGTRKEEKERCASSGEYKKERNGLEENDFNFD